MRLSCLRPVLLVVLMAFGYLAHGADPLPYRVDIAATGDGDRDATLKSTSDLESLRTSAPVSPFGLIARARSDVDRFTTVLESFGYYECRVVIKINGKALSDPTLGDALAALPKGSDARAALAFSLGTLYHLRRSDIDGVVPERINARETLGLTTGPSPVPLDLM